MYIKHTHTASMKLVYRLTAASDMNIEHGLTFDRRRILARPVSFMSIEFIVECMHTTIHLINCFVNICRTSAHQTVAQTTKITESFRIYFSVFICVLYIYISFSHYLFQVEQIQAEYKVLALQYHPDKNSGDKEAEAKFQALKVSVGGTESDRSCGIGSNRLRQFSGFKDFVYFIYRERCT